jgi:hypothetical protein
MIMDDSNILEFSGMELVRVLCGRVHNSRFENVLTPSFHSNYESFLYRYHLNDGLGYRKEVVVLPIQT